MRAARLIVNMSRLATVCRAVGLDGYTIVKLYGDCIDDVWPLAEAIVQMRREEEARRAAAAR